MYPPRPQTPRRRAPPHAAPRRLAQVASRPAAAGCGGSSCGERQRAPYGRSALGSRRLHPHRGRALRTHAIALGLYVFACSQRTGNTATVTVAALQRHRVSWYVSFATQTARAQDNECGPVLWGTVPHADTDTVRTPAIPKPPGRCAARVRCTGYTGTPVYPATRRRCKRSRDRVLSLLNDPGGAAAGHTTAALTEAGAASRGDEPGCFHA